MQGVLALLQGDIIVLVDGERGVFEVMSRRTGIRNTSEYEVY